MNDLLTVAKFIVEIGGVWGLVGFAVALIFYRKAERAEARAQALSDKLIESGQEASRRMSELAFQTAQVQQRLAHTVSTAVKTEGAVEREGR